MYHSPRIAEMLAPEKHDDIIVNMKSYISIVMRWQSVSVNLNSKNPHFFTGFKPTPWIWLFKSIWS